MVVGIRHTSSAISTVNPTTVPEPACATANAENGLSVTITIMNTSVSPTSKIDNASSFGVFWRLADSTMEIMRSRNDSPGFTVICTTSQSDSTRVPPVTDEKSPPASRITGAESPVMALSSTDATPSSTVPSSAMVSPASIKITAPERSSLEGTGVHCAP
ncbi:hypothetical protein SDC9_92741 [bioreactor metagenome]|uniref:Uncharacterized protein n=1 Tax=bioreactor metagenome TaxID=1076179 RepID=A0A644ZZ55_9ZZZZ